MHLTVSLFRTSEVVQSTHQQYKSNERIYKLNAAVIHVGENVNNGHIFSYIRSPDHKWCEAGDELVNI